MNARFVPIEVWPGDRRAPGDRRNSPFRGSWKNTLDTLDRELLHLGARDVLVQGYFRSDDIRLDGWPRSGACPSTPGVIVSFRCKLDGKMTDLSYPCDTYTHWQDNLRAIALGLAALRAVERYGVTRRNEQYKGWAKLPPAPAAMAAKDTLAFMALHSGLVEITADNAGSAYKAAARRLHPDAGNQNPHLFHLLTQAKEALAANYGWTF